MEPEEGNSSSSIQPAMYVEVEQRPAAAQRSVIGCGSTDPSLGSRYVVTVKLECPDGQVITQAWTLSASASSLKERLSRLVDLPVGTLHLIHGGRPVQDHVTLGDLGGKVNETISLSFRSVDPVVYPIRLKRQDLMPLPDVITVRVRPRNGRPARDVVVEIENQNIRQQPFLGGWRKRNTGMCFYHAQTQTDYSVGADDRLYKIDTGVQSKDCQVATIGDNHTQTSPSVSSQVRTFDWSRKGEISSTLGSSLFVHADDTLNEEQEEEKSAIVIQRKYKQWVSERRSSSTTLPDSSSEESVSNPLLIHPSIEPVEALIIRFGDVTIEKSRLPVDETKQQQAWADDQQRLFFHEIELLNSSKDSATKDRILRRLLNRVSQPKLWKASTGAVVEVDTAEIEHLRDTRIMYEAICSSTLTEDRVRALHLLKRTLHKESGSTVKEILQLADRELDLLGRGLMSSSLSGLQSRLRALLRHFITENKLPLPQFS